MWCFRRHPRPAFARRVCLRWAGAGSPGHLSAGGATRRFVGRGRLTWGCSDSPEPGSARRIPRFPPTQPNDPELHEKLIPSPVSSPLSGFSLRRLRVCAGACACAKHDSEPWWLVRGEGTLVDQENAEGPQPTANQISFGQVCSSSCHDAQLLTGMPNWSV